MAQDLSRYSRQVVFPLVGEVGQRKLLESRVLLIGCGALGSGIAELLARAGVGYLRIVDRDVVELHNLQRQTLFDERHVRDEAPKAVAAAERIAQINSDIEVEPHVADVTPDNVQSLFESIDLVVDGTDNWGTRYLINDVSVMTGIPWVYGGVIGASGLVMPIIPGQTPCLRCVYPDPPAVSGETCETAGVLGAAVWIVASLQAVTALRLLTGREGEPVLSTIDAWNGSIERLPITERVPGCPACGEREFEFLDAAGAGSVRLCGRNSIQISPSRAGAVNLDSLAQQLESLGPVRHNSYLLKFTIDSYEMTVFSDARVIIKGTEDESTARSLYAKYIGG